MEAIKVLQGKAPLDWEYDEGADVLYISAGKPQKALGVVVRYDEQRHEVVGLTIIGLKARVQEQVEDSE